LLSIVSLCLGYTTDTLFWKPVFLKHYFSNGSRYTTDTLFRKRTLSKLCFSNDSLYTTDTLFRHRMFRNFVFQTVADTLQTLCFARARRRGLQYARNASPLNGDIPPPLTCSHFTIEVLLRFWPFTISLSVEKDHGSRYRHLRLNAAKEIEHWKSPCWELRHDRVHVLPVTLY